MASDGLTFKLFGEDVNASKALDGIGEKAKGVAGAVGAAFVAIGIGGILQQGFDDKKVLAKFTAGLGQTPEVAKQAGDAAGELYRDGIGASLEDVTDAVGAVGTNMVDLSKTAQPELKKITQGAIDIASVMGVDVVDVTKAAGQMMKNGLAPNAQAALDIISTGATNGANASGDLLDTLNEYGPSFNELGVSGPTALGMIKAGLDNGIMSSDLAADAFKEFSIRSIDGSTATGQAYADLGLDAGKMSADIAAGGPAAQTATGQVMTALANMTDPMAQNAAGTALFGTQWEDAGPKAILAMNPVQQKIDDVGGATASMGETLNDTATTKVEAMQRHFQGFLTDLTNVEGPMGTVAAAVVTFAPQILGYAGSFGMMAVAMKDLGIFTKGAAIAQGILNVAMWTSPLAVVLAIVVALVAAFLFLKQVIPQVLEALNDGTPPTQLISNTQWQRNLGAPIALPGHAAGGIVMPQRGGQAGIIGEGGEPEAIVPLSKWADMTGGNGGPGTTVNVYVSGAVVGSTDQLARYVVDGLNSARRRGMIPANALAGMAG